MAGVVLFVAAAVIAFRRHLDPPWLDVQDTGHELHVGVGDGVPGHRGPSRDYTIEVPWSSQLLHFWIPALAVLNWILDFGKARLGWKTLSWIVVYPLAWGAFT